MTEWLDRTSYGNYLPKGGYDISNRHVLYEVDHHTPEQNPTNIEAALWETNRILGWHTNSNGWGDIGYTWLVHDRYAIEGRGYGQTGAHAPGANSNSIGIAFLLDGRYRSPTPTEWNTAKDIMERGVLLGYVTPGYLVRGHRDFVETTCPGDQCYNHIHDPRGGGILEPPPGHAPTEIPEVEFHERPEGFDDPGIPTATGESDLCLDGYVREGQTICVDSIGNHGSINVVFYHPIAGRIWLGEKAVLRHGSPVLHTIPQGQSGRWSVVTPNIRLSDNSPAVRAYVV